MDQSKDHQECVMFVTHYWCKKQLLISVEILRKLKNKNHVMGLSRKMSAIPLLEELDQLITFQKFNKNNFSNSCLYTKKIESCLKL